MSEQIQVTRPANLNQSKLLEELNAAGFVPVALSGDEVALFVEVYEDWSSLTEGEKQTRRDLVAATVAAHTGELTADQTKAQAEGNNRTTLHNRLTQALAANKTYRALSNPTNAQNLAQIRLLTDECSALIRLALNRLEAAD